MVVLPRSGAFCEKLAELQIPYCIIPFFGYSFSTKGVVNRILLPLRVLRMWLVNFFAFGRLRRLCMAERANLVFSNVSVIDIGQKVAQHCGIKHLWYVREKAFGLKPWYGRAELLRRLGRADCIVATSQLASIVADGCDNLVVLLDPVKRKSLGLADMNQLAAEDGDEGGESQTSPAKMWTHQEIVPNPVAMPIVNPYNCDSSAGRPYFLLCGYIAPVKGMEVAITAFAEFCNDYPEYRLLIAGDRPVEHREYQRKLDQLVADLGMEDNVVFLGYRQDCPELMVYAKAYLSTSHDEGFARVVAEAMLMRCPVIVWRSPGNAARELIESELSGYMCDEVKGLPGLMRRAVEDADFAKVLPAAYEFARDKCSPEKYAGRMLNIMLKAVNTEEAEA